jgi:hypothetical protein
MSNQPDHQSKGTLKKENGDTAFDDTLTVARRDRLNECLRTLSSWVDKQTLVEHNPDTTLEILQRKVQEVVHSVEKAGWNALPEHKQT